MIKHNQDGATSALLITLILVILLLLGTAYFGYWAYSSRQDYKNNTDAKINAAVNNALQKQSQTLNAAFAQEKNPLTTYTSPVADGSIVLHYPKTWSGYVDTTGSNGSLLTSYFNPGVVPSISDSTSIFALNMQLLNQPYSQVIQQIQSTQGVTASAYSLPKLPKIVGLEASGPLINNINVTEVILPLRSYTLELVTYGDQYLGDFNNIILPNISFSP